MQQQFLATTDGGWHRRERARRAKARQLLRVHKAACLLNQHHGSRGQYKMGWTCTNAACFVSVFDAVQSVCPNCGQKAAPHGYAANRANGGKGQGGPTNRYGGFKGTDAKGTAAQKGKGKGKGGKGGPAGNGPQDPQAAIPGPNRSKKGALGRIPQKMDNTVWSRHTNCAANQIPN